MAECQPQELVTFVGGKKSDAPTPSKKTSQKYRRKSSVGIVTSTRPPDGGYGWVVCAVSFYTMLLAGGTIMCYGVIYVEFLDYFRETRTKTSWIGSLMLLSISLAGPLSSALSIRFGHRAVVIMGGLIAALSLAASASAHSIYYLYASFGVFGGLGIGLAIIPAISLLALYFDKKRSTAIAIAFSGGGISYLVFPPMMDVCMSSITWRGAMFVLASLWMHCCVGGALLRPLTVREDIFLDRRMSRFSISDHDTTANNVNEKPIEIEPPPGSCDMVLFKNWRFWLYLLQEFLWHVDFMNFTTILPDFAILNGFDKTQSGLLLTIFGAVVIPSRLVGGFMVDKLRINPLLLLTILIAVMGASSVVFPFTWSSYPAMAVVCGVRGATNGLLPIIGPSILALLFTNERLTTALGYGVFAIGAGQLTAPPMAGVIYDQTGDYLSAYLTCAFISFTASGIALVLFLDKQKSLRMEKVEAQEEMEEKPETVPLKHDASDA